MLQALEALLENRYAIAAAALFVSGLSTLLHQRELIRKVIGFNIMDAAVFLLLASRGYVEGRSAPIVAPGTQEAAAALYVNPIPTGLVLTGIVVSVSVSAFSLALIQRIHRKYGTTDIRELAVLTRGEE